MKPATFHHPAEIVVTEADAVNIVFQNKFLILGKRLWRRGGIIRSECFSMVAMNNS
jgi:hypothetical protein